MTKLNATEVEQGLQEQLEPWVPYLSRNTLGPLVVVKGVLGAAEALGLPAFSGADGEALEKAFVRLGYGPDSWCGIFVCPAGHPPLSPENLALILEILAPVAVMALDEEANQLYQAQAAKGERPYVALANFEEALCSEAGKKEAWVAMRQGLA